MSAFGAHASFADDPLKSSTVKKRGSSDTGTRPTLLTAPIELAGNWGHMIPDAARHVVERMRTACLDAVRLVSDRQPARLRVDEHTSGNPAIWLHPDPPDLAWIIVDIGERDWSKLAYQFGHELGHVTANSWGADAKPGGPSQWLEEAMVEAFSLRGLTLLADDWSRDPPFTNDSGFGAALATYRQNIIERYGKLAIEQGNPKNLGAWFKEHRAAMEGQPGLNAFAQAVSLSILAEYERNPGGIEALGALNRWPGRATVPIENYLHAWETSCIELRASTDLPIRLRAMLDLS
jgi:hypothetical protein